nr:nascent polypeptide-associated complex protein [Candidatus Njordarchaeota archaeon]
MFPRKMDPRTMRRLMGKMGLKIEEVGDVDEVIFRMTSGVELVIQNPQVTRMKTGNTDVFQVVGAPMQRTSEGHGVEGELSPEDVKLVADQVGVGLDEARDALIESKGDLAQAILNLKLQKSKQ